MRRPNRARLVLAGLALATLAAAGCAAISGLDGITELACAPDCDGGGGGVDSTVPAPDAASPGSDATPGDDATTLAETSAPGDDGATSNDGTGPDAPDGSRDDAGGTSADSGGVDAGADAAGVDAGHDAGHPDAAVDAGSDGSCGPLNTVANCSACGDTCTATNAQAPACNGTTCSYTCKTNFLDCNAAKAPDLDGCECNAPGATSSQCCAGACPQQHHYDLDLLSSTFYDCVAQGAYNATVATDACGAFTGDVTQCDNGGFTFFCNYADGGVAGYMICSNGPTATACDCWGYSGALQGLMSTGTGKGQANCLCPQPGGTQWN